jgi:hypothetical protein
MNNVNKEHFLEGFEDTLKEDVIKMVQSVLLQIDF